jgi:hypothetical protein
MKPNESLFKTHLESPIFLSGRDSGRWGLYGSMESIDLAAPVLWVRADKRFAPDQRIFLRFDIQNYPQLAPTGCPWDVRLNAKLAPALWPRGGHVSTVFNPAWNDHALYAPCDRLAMQGHDVWKSVSAQWWWQPTFTVVKYLEFVHVCLNPADHENS